MAWILAAAATASAFNLVCDGTSSFGKILSGDRTPAHREYRIDLTEQRYCMDACKETVPINAVYERAIFFSVNEKGSGPTSDVHMVNRESGVLIDRMWLDQDFVSIISATCQIAPFSGFPTRKF